MSMITLPGLTEKGDWDLPSTLNMARQCLSGSPERTAIVDLTGTVQRKVTLAALHLEVDKIAHALLQHVGRGDRVGVLLSQSVWCAAAHLAIWKIGAISVPLFTLFQQDALASRLSDAGCAVVLSDAEGCGRLEGLAVAWRVDACGIEGDALPFAETGPEDPAVLIYTSGTTGKPKGALHGHRVLTGHLPGVALSHDYLGQSGDCLWTPADWAWIGGLFDVVMPGLVLGVPVVATRPEKFSARGCAEIISRGNIRNVFLPPTALRMLKAADAKIFGLRSIASGGEPLGAEMMAWARDAFGLAINEFYGQTECNMVVSSCHAAFTAVPGCMGQPVPGHVLAVLDQDGKPTQAEGDIAVHRGSPSMMLRYWGQPEATADKFRGDWLITGDRGSWEGAFLRFVGREDDVITSSGYRIGPAEIEDCLLMHPDVVTCGVVGKPDHLRTEIVKAYVVRQADSMIGAEELQRWVKDRLASYLFPREIAFVNALPMTVTGKVIRQALKLRAAQECEVDK